VNATGGQDVHILDRLAVLYRHRVVALVVFALTIAATLVQRGTSVPQYQARARILIDEERRAILRSMPVPMILSEFANRDRYFQGQYQILKSRDLALKVVKKLNVDQPPAAFISHVGVEPISGSQLVDVTFVSPDPKFAALALNTLLDTYVDDNLEIRLQARRKMVEWLDEQVADQLKKVTASERALAEYREKQHAPSLDEKQNLVSPRWNKLSDDAARATANRFEKESSYTRAKSTSPERAAELPSLVARNPALQSLNARLTDLELERSRLAERYGDKHPAIQTIAANILDARRQRDAEIAKALQSLKNDYEVAVREERAVTNSLGVAKSDLIDSGRKNVHYSVLESEAKTVQQVYESLLNQENALRLLNSSRANNVRLVDRADSPKTPLASSTPYGWLIGVGVGLVLAVGAAFGLDYMDDTIKLPEDIARHLKLPCLGLVPAIRDETATMLMSAKAPEEFGEAFRSIRTSLAAGRTRGTVATLVVTSTQPQEGKTTTACNIAMALALSDSRVLLIDADMRRPSVHRAMRLTNDRGLSQVLVGGCRLRDAIQRTVHPNLLAVTAGATAHNAADLLTSERLKALLHNLQHGPFDWVIIDTPPVLAATDAVGLAPLVSGVLFVVGAELTRRRAAERAVETLRSTQMHFVGAVLNKVDVARNRYYYSRHYGYQYKNRYAQSA
jgi:capsular exopolysaccharide synthesis family protein